MNNDELLDLVNNKDQIIGQKLRSEIYTEKLTNFRVVNALIINDLGYLWIPRRSKEKKLFPLCLDASMGGHVSSGESYLDAFKRETLEELRIDVEQKQYIHWGSLTPAINNTSAFMQIYLLKTNEVPNYNRKDFVEYFWLKPQELLNKLTTDKAKDDLPRIIKALFPTQP